MALNDAFGSGGLSVGNPGQATDGLTGSGFLGRVLNNLTGKTADNQFNAQEAEKARLFNSAEAQKARDWETMMSNTAYQRAAADMQAAGINPASLGGNGSGSAASSPSGPSASGSAAHSGSGSGINLVGMVMEGIGMALKDKAMRSALGYKSEALNVRKFEANSRAVLDAARTADRKVTSAIKQESLNSIREAKAEKKAVKSQSRYYKEDEELWEDLDREFKALGIYSDFSTRKGSKGRRG